MRYFEVLGPTYFNQLQQTFMIDQDSQLKSLIQQCPQTGIKVEKATNLHVKRYFSGT